MSLGGAIAMIGGNVEDRVAVRYNIALETPLAAQLILQEVLVGACRLAIDGVVGAHDGAGFAFHDGGAESWLVGIDLIVLAHVHIGKVTRGLGSAVHVVVFGCCDGQVIPGVIALQSGHVGNAHASGEEGIFAVGFLTAAPARVAENVQIRGPEIQASHDARMPFAHILHVLDASLDTDLGRHGVDSRRIERGSKADGLGVLGYTVVDDPVEGLTPPLICRNV